MRIDGVAVAGVGMVRFGKYPDRSGPALARDAAPPGGRSCDHDP